MKLALLGRGWLGGSAQVEGDDDGGTLQGIGIL
jgi:hypothetical protein